MEGRPRGCCRIGVIIMNYVEIKEWHRAIIDSQLNNIFAVFIFRVGACNRDGDCDYVDDDSRVSHMEDLPGGSSGGHIGGKVVLEI